jgi:hypothetical protein
MGASTSTTVGSPDFWLQPWKKQAVIGFHREHPLEGYRRLTFMMPLQRLAGATSRIALPMEG